MRTWLPAGLLLCGLCFGAIRVYHLEREEVAFEGDSRALSAFQAEPGGSRVSARLAKLSLDADKLTTFEVCSATALDEAWRDRITFAVFRLDPLELMLKVPLTAARLGQVQRGPAGGCLVLGSGPLPNAGDYTIDAAWPGVSLSDTERSAVMRARVLARKPLALTDRVALYLTAGGALWLAVGLVRRKRRPRPAATPAVAAPTGIGPQETPSGHGRRPAWVVLGSVLGAVALLASASQLPLWGATWGLAKGIGLASLQVGLSLALMGLAGAALPFSLTRGQAALAAGTGALLVVQARLALKWVPSTGQAPIEAFIAWPSGTLAFALLGAVLPLAEELFFRGFIFGALDRRSRALAVCASIGLFAALHAQQSWGNWGALASITTVGVVLTGLRAVTDSLPACMLAHLLYNLVLARSAYF